MKCKNCQRETTRKVFCRLRCRVDFSTQKRVCVWCKKSFFIKKHRPDRYCSKNCFFLECRTHFYKVNCKQCKKIITIKKVRLVRRENFFCGVGCREKSKIIF